MSERVRAWGLRALFAGWLLGTGLLVWVLLVMPLEGPGGPDRDFVVELPEGASYEQIAALLAKQQVLTHPRAWAFYMRILTEPHELRTGTWVVNRALTPAALLPRFVTNRGQGVVKVLVPEGFTMFDVATRLERFGIAEKRALLTAMRAPALLAELEIPSPSVEGYLFPATYALHQDSPPVEVVRRLVATFHKRTRLLFEEHAREHAADVTPAFTRHQLLTLASIVEREAHAAEEQTIIAGVFVNRLLDPTFRPHRLQADPTAAYGCLVAPEAAPSCKEFDGRRVTPAMVRDPANPYNTYRIEGLPPGPISNPGLSAIQAAVRPAQHTFFYFVARGGGRHAFSSTLEEHNARIRGTP
jgi:UPF0755 protein